MPIYEFKCDKCLQVKDFFCKIDERESLKPECCSLDMKRILSAARVIEDIKPYKSMVTGEMITSRSEHRDHLKKHRLVEIGNEPIKTTANSIDLNVRDELRSATREVLSKQQ